MLRSLRGRRFIAALLTLGGIALGLSTGESGPEGARAQTIGRDAGPYVGNRNSKVFHLPTCGALGRTSPTSKIEIPNERVATANGFRPCRTCNPTAASGSAVIATVAMAPRPARAIREAGASTAQTPEPPLRFSRDIAPILIGNCLNCHNPRDKARRNNLDLTTFRALSEGGDSGPAVVASKPLDSLLLQRVKGIDGPKMPPGNRDLAPETIAKLERWIEQGAALDDGLQAEAELRSYAPSPDELRRADLDNLDPEELDRRVREAALQRWAKATSAEPTFSTSGRVLLVSRLPEARAEELRKQINAQIVAIAQLLGPPAQTVLGGRVKLSVFVFDDRVAFAEFVRSVDGRDPDPAELARANLDAEMPYLVAVPPQPEVEATPAKGERRAPVPRSLAGILTEPLVAEATRRSGNPPRWLCLGLGASMAQRVDPRSTYAAQLRMETLDMIGRGGLIQAQELLGGQGDDANVRAFGFSLLEWIGTANRATFTPFVRAMLADGSKFDDVIRQGYRAEREAFLRSWATWATQSYARRR